jgi:hypothetical protein
VERELPMHLNLESQQRREQPETEFAGAWKKDKFKLDKL